MLLLLSACTVWHPPLSGLMLEPAVPMTWDDVFAHPVESVTLDSVVSGRWVAQSKGLINLDHPDAVAAGLKNRDFPIALTVHVIDHPRKGRWIVDTGVAVDEDGDLANIQGLLGSVLSNTEILTPLDEILGEAPLNGVLLTHKHVDHVMGMGDVKKGTPIVGGPGEWGQKGAENALLRKGYKRLLKGHDVRELRLEDAVEIGEFKTWDLHGDGSVWVLYTPGHTPGSLSFVVNNGSPTLLVGDSSHTWWGWDNGVEPGGYTEDSELNRASLHALRRLAEAHDMRVEVGHEEHFSITEPQSPGSAE
ncbi:MAG: MBL fold metallo-hydrolase [Proteobacteria bacterium]|nr:MBL fold metallo-hydrolase [Pseudomonadota bacterium]MCP4917755.1 MBL fold metallo-hydrolase [Pseudomonadota bacterium]